MTEEEATRETSTVVIREEDYLRFVDHVEMYPEENPSYAGEYVKRTELWLAMFNDIDGRVAAGQLTPEEANSLKARITAANEVEKVHDELTHVLNRRGFYETFEKKAASSNSICALVIDIDDFKKLNDQFGHNKGDEILIKVAEAIKQSVRKDDIVGRTGGDEFAVGSINCNLEEAKELADRIARSLSGVRTVSIGVGKIRLGESLPKFMDRIDKAMFQAKGMKTDSVSQIVVSPT